MNRIRVVSLSVLLLISSPAFCNAQTATPQPAAQNGQAQPQGPTGPITTGTGGAPASSPQGETPPGMQAAPQGSDTSITTSQTKDDKK